MKEIKKINNLSLANILAAINGLIGFFTGVIMAIISAANLIGPADSGNSVIIITLANIGASILLGLLVALATACLGWLFGYIMAAIYNTLAVRIGGIIIELKDVNQRDEN